MEENDPRTRSADPIYPDRLSRLLDAAFQIGSLPESIERLVRLRADNEQAALPSGNDLRRAVAEALWDIQEQRVRRRMVEEGSLREWIGTLIIREGLLQPVLLWARGPQRRLRERQDNIRTIKRLGTPRIVSQWAPPEMVDDIVRYPLLDGRRASSTFYDLRDEGERVLLEEVEAEIALLRSAPPGAKESSAAGKQPPSTVQPPVAACAVGQATGVLWPDLLPSPYVPRLRCLEQLRQALLETAGRGGWIVMSGMPGVGKSALLAAFLHGVQDDPDMRVAFPDGIAFAAGGPSQDAQTEVYALIHRLAAQLGIALPEEGPSLNRRLEAFKTGLRGHRALILVDNVVAPDLPAALQDLPAGVVGVAVTPSQQVSVAIRPTREIGVRGLELDEAMQLAAEIAGALPTGPGEAAARGLCQLVEGHPLALRVLAEQARLIGWAELHQAVIAGISVHGGPAVGLAERVNSVLERAWQRVGALLQHRLAALGQLPYFGAYDLLVGQAVWKINRSDAYRAWEQLAAAGLVEPVHGQPGRYHLHWLVWDFSRQKEGVLSQAERRRLVAWPWRYPLSEVVRGWRWWWPCVPKPPGKWPLLDATIPGTKAVPGTTTPLSWLRRSGWARVEDRLQLQPAEYALVQRRVWMAWAALVPSGIGGAGFVLFLLADIILRARTGQGFETTPGLLLLLALTTLLLAAFFVFFEDARRVVWWRTLGETPSILAGGEEPA